MAYPTAMPLTGAATADATAGYWARHPGSHSDHIRSLRGVSVSSIGLGTYLGDQDDHTDQLYQDAIRAAVGAGCNLLDSAINYRCQRSERAVGLALAQLTGDGTITRDEIVLCTKGGYIPFDGEVPADPGQYVVQTFLGPGIITYDELVANCHCISPRYLEHQLQASLANLGVSTIDVYYLHNPEHQLEALDRARFLTRIEAAFRMLEAQVAKGAIRWYGTATWNGYRVSPQSRNYLSLEELVEVARRVAGEAHHFRVIQAPYNLIMPEAAGFNNQPVDGKRVSLFEAAREFGITAIVSASLLQSQLAKLPAALARFIPDLQTDAQRAIQFVRSTPGVTTALVGMKQPEHVQANLALAAQPALANERLGQLFSRHPR